MNGKTIGTAALITSIIICLIVTYGGVYFFGGRSSQPDGAATETGRTVDTRADTGLTKGASDPPVLTNQGTSAERGKDAAQRIALTELDGRGPGDLGRLAERLKVASSPERFLAVQQLEKIGTKEALEALAVALGDEELSVSTAAAASITRLCGYQPDSYRPVTSGARAAQVRQFQSWLDERKKLSLSEMKLEALKERSQSRD